MGDKIIILQQFEKVWTVGIISKVFRFRAPDSLSDNRVIDGWVSLIIICPIFNNHRSQTFYLRVII